MQLLTSVRVQEIYAIFQQDCRVVPLLSNDRRPLLQIDTVPDVGAAFWPRNACSHADTELLRFYTRVI